MGRSTGRIAWESPRAALLAFADELRSGGVPLAGEFAEMIRVEEILGESGADADRTGSGRPAGELLAQAMTAAESTSTLLLATVAARARDARLDDEALIRMMAAATVLVARFDSYLAERDAVEPV